MGSVDMLSLPKVYEWLNETIINAIKPLMVWPQKLQFTLGQGEVVSEHSSMFLSLFLVDSLI